VFDDREAVVLLARDHVRGLAHRRVGLDRHRVRRHHVLGRGGERLAGALLEVRPALEEHDAAEQLEVVRQVEVLTLVGQHEVGLGDDPDAAPALVDHGNAAEVVLVHHAQDQLDGVRDRNAHGIGIHDVSHRQRHSGQD
jgi:hypothetical protein